MLNKFLPQLQSFRTLSVNIDNSSSGRKAKENWNLNVTQSLNINIGVPKIENAPPVANVTIELTAIATPTESGAEPAKFSATYKILFSFSKETTEEEVNHDMDTGGNIKYFIENQAGLISLLNFKELLTTAGFSTNKIGYFM